MVCSCTWAVDDSQLCLGVRNEYWGDLASVVPSHRASVLSS